MPPTEPTAPETPSTEIVPADDVQPETPSPESPKPSSLNLWERIFGPRDKSGDDKATEGDESQAGQSSAKTIALTEEELDRRVQAETDRREAKRQKEAAAKAEQDRRQAIERKLDPLSPDYAPYEGTEEQAKLKAEEEANQRIMGVFNEVQRTHDAHTLDVLIEALPEPERKRILELEGAGVGLEGRKLIVSESLKSLERHWKNVGMREAEEKLRKDPTLRKRLFHEFRGDTEEPELVVGSATSNGHDWVKDILQADYKRLKGRA